MKTFICICLVLAFIFGGSPAYAIDALKDDDIAISAPSAILMEKTTGEVLYEKNAHDRLSPASITKIMTLLLIMEDIDAGKLSTEDIVTASRRAASFGGSCVYLEEGERMSVHEMIKCIAVVSANDCAVAMAEHLCGTEQLFVERMNAKAEELGLQDTHYTNCSGIYDDAEHYTSAYDVAIVSRELLKHETIKEYSTIWMDSIRGGKFELSNTNKLVYWYPDCTGLKTGFTSKAKYCLAATAQRDGVEYITVIMRSESSDMRNEDATILLNYGFANYTLCSLDSGEPLPEVTVDMGKESRVKLVRDSEAFALIPKSSAIAEYHLELPDRVSAPVKKGQQIGTLTVSAAGQEIKTIALCAAEDVPRIGFAGIFLRLAKSLTGL